MDAVRTLITDRAEALRITLAALSKKAGRNHAYLQQFIKRGIPHELPERVRAVLAKELEVTEDQLRIEPLAAPPVSAEPPAASGKQNAIVRGPIQIGTMIPLFGQAAGGSEGQFVLNGNKIQDILAPPALTGVRDAYAVYVVGDSMEPRYHAGEAVFVNPRLPVRRGDYVVAQIAGEAEGEAPSAFVKRFISFDTRTLKLEQFNPKKTLQFPHNSVVSVHRIIMGGDG